MDGPRMGTTHTVNGSDGPMIKGGPIDTTRANHSTAINIMNAEHRLVQDDGRSDHIPSASLKVISSSQV